MDGGPVLTLKADKARLGGLETLPRMQNGTLHLVEGETDQASLQAAGAGAVVSLPGAGNLHREAVPGGGPFFMRARSCGLVVSLCSPRGGSQDVGTPVPAAGGPRTAVDFGTWLVAIWAERSGTNAFRRGQSGDAQFAGSLYPKTLGSGHWTTFLRLRAT